MPHVEISAQVSESMLRYLLKSASLSCYFLKCGSVYSRDLCRVTSYSEKYYLP